MHFALSGEMVGFADSTHATAEHIRGRFEFAGSQPKNESPRI